MVHKGNKQPPDFKGAAKKLKRKGKSVIRERKAKRRVTESGTRTDVTNVLDPLRPGAQASC